jgi:3-oxoacyl-[acyl-carrier-protein] synthase III
MKHNAADGLFTKPPRKEGMMREVAVVGAGITTCKGRWVERTHYGLSQMAVKAALEDACISVKDADAVVYGIYTTTSLSFPSSRNTRSKKSSVWQTSLDYA